MIKGNCYVCGKAGHRAKDCYKRNDHFKGNNNYKNKTHKQNQQQVGSSSQVEEESNEEIEENNLFSHLYKISSQKIIAQQVPECLLSNSLTEIDYETDPRRFSVTANVEGQQVSVLVDTGSMISTINEELVEDMALKKDDENEVWIEYGNATKEVARQSVSIHLNISGNDFVYKLLVVKRQNVPIILGMDFFVETNLLLDPVSKSFIYRNTGVKTQNMQTEEIQDFPEEIKAAREKYPSIFNTESMQSITNAPVEHCIDTVLIARLNKKLNKKTIAAI